MEATEKRDLPVGTPIVLKKPLTGDVGWRDFGDKSFSLGRIQGRDEDHYEIVFEGLTDDQGKQVVVSFTRDEFVLARSGT